MAAPFSDRLTCNASSVALADVKLNNTLVPTAIKFSRTCKTSVCYNFDAFSTNEIA